MGGGVVLSHMRANISEKSYHSDTTLLGKISLLDTTLVMTNNEFN